MPPLLSIAISVIVALAGWRARALTGSGAVAATLVGSAILWRTEWPGLAALGVFFVGSSVISRLAPDYARIRLDAKGNQRDPAQVLANGAAAAIGALLLPPQPALWLVSAALAAAAADTWATSVGAWSRTVPRYILTGAKVPRGTSGGVTLVGTAGALLGAATVGAAAALVAGNWSLLVEGCVIGTIGMTVDSLLGATWQGRFHCPACDTPTERRRHWCGAPTVHVRGWPWVTNDLVNGIATAVAAVLGVMAWHWLVA